KYFGDYELLTIKSALDFFAAMAFAASLGVGVFFSVITVFVVQGGLALGGFLAGEVMTGDMINELTATGGLLLLGLSLILLDVKAETKEELFISMISQAAKTGVIRNKAEFLQSVAERELQMPTSIGRKVAVPHGRVASEKEQIVVIFARLAHEMVYDESTGETVRFIFMVSTGTNETEYLTALRMIATNIQNGSVYQRLLTARDRSEVHHLFSEIKLSPSVKK
ncbi:MAG: DUF554 family protein, partial [Bacteroidetes bacterium]|nr:DUF554 family protein [Bacteroidota bacterium]